MNKKEENIADTNLHIIRLLAQRIKEKFHPEEIILFGSYAYGNPDNASDIDLLIVMESKERYPKTAAKIQIYLEEVMGKVYPMDILVRSRKDIEKRIKQGDFFIKTIIEKGIPL
jgi:predicted nucleotidyltransferase